MKRAQRHLPVRPALTEDVGGADRLLQENHGDDGAGWGVEKKNTFRSKTAHHRRSLDRK